jgi:hypothetical protein
MVDNIAVLQQIFDNMKGNIKKNIAVPQQICDNMKGNTKFFSFIERGVEAQASTAPSFWGGLPHPPDPGGEVLG